MTPAVKIPQSGLETVESNSLSLCLLSAGISFLLRQKKKRMEVRAKSGRKKKKCLECETGLNLLKHLDGPAPYKLEKNKNK